MCTSCTAHCRAMHVETTRLPTLTRQLIKKSMRQQAGEPERARIPPGQQQQLQVAAQQMRAAEHTAVRQPQRRRSRGQAWLGHRGRLRPWPGREQGTCIAPLLSIARTTSTRALLIGCFVKRRYNNVNTPAKRLGALDFPVRQRLSSHTVPETVYSGLAGNKTQEKTPGLT